jgi:two-component system response regulator HydG
MTLVARSRVMREILAQARRFAGVNSTLLITGETGVGKNALARFVHDAGSRRRHPFVTVDCPALPETLVASELFGHERGAFTDATATRRGPFEAAGLGSVYLDSVSSLAPAGQAALLRLVDERRVTRLGGTTVIALPARLIASAEPDLEEQVRGGRFRSDLFHRLRVLTLAVPPLRQRPEDILPLAAFLLRAIAGRLRKPAPAISEAAAAALLRYRWPGNVRELGHVLERMSIGSGDLIDVTSLPLEVLATDAADNGDDEARRPTLLEVEQRYIALTLRRVHGNQTRAAAILGISRKALWEKRRRYGIG